MWPRDVTMDRLTRSWLRGEGDGPISCKRFAHPIALTYGDVREWVDDQ